MVRSKNSGQLSFCRPNNASVDYLRALTLSNDKVLRKGFALDGSHRERCEFLRRSVFSA